MEIMFSSIVLGGPAIENFYFHSSRLLQNDLLQHTTIN